ncbi:MAG: FtsX-like permease family protein [Planctomycetes bacterium]|nr:FtsX-like permease family protein [Planctomycetota bacterium]NBY02304.1 FtsX-like permease family protein [Planctomycetota bacterium]
MNLSSVLVTSLVSVVCLTILLALVGKVPINYSIRNLIVRWPISLMTALAFTMVIGVLIVMLAFVNGMYKLTESSGHPENIIVLSDGATDEIFSNLGYSDVSEIEFNPGVSRDELGKPLTSWETYVIVNQPIPLHARKGDRRRRFIQVRGILDPERSGKVHHLVLKSGDWFSTGESGGGVREVLVSEPGKEPRKVNATEAVLGQGIAKEIGPDYMKPSLEVGDVFNMGDKYWVVAGIMDSGGSTFDSEIWAKWKTVAERFGKVTYTTLVIKTDSKEIAYATTSDIVKNFKKAALQAFVETDYYDKLNNTNKQFLVAILFVAAVVAIGGVFGIMNTMFAAISQRSKDIGVLRIVGFAPWQILVSFFLEAILLSFFGGVLGCIVGSFADGFTASSIMSSGAGGGKNILLRLTVDMRLIFSGILFAVAMGMVGGLLPAVSAMRIKPLESLR